MRFTILSHAGLLVEHAGVRIVFDPWLLGSCYWRSWWNFPEPDPQLIADLRADYVYLTHLHWDHFHGPSLRKLFSPDTRMLVPKVPTRRMLEDLDYLGFRHVTEIPHGAAVSLGADLVLHSYQFGVGVDSGAILRGGGVTLFNCNDAKFFGRPLRQIMRDHPTIDFIFRSHSSAGPLPYCVDNHEQLLPGAAANSDSAEQFVRCALHVGARYAIPFASNHCFLHRETEQFNASAVTPEDVRRRYQQAAMRLSRQSECVVMPPGSSWSDADGFDIRPFDFAARHDYIDSLRVRHRHKLQDSYQREDQVAADFDSFCQYFQGLFAALPGIVRRRVLTPAVFCAREACARHYWLVDPARGSIEQLSCAPPDRVVFEVHAAVLRDCTVHRMFSVWTASKRLKILLPCAAALTQAERWFTILDLYELGTFPLALNFSARTLAVRLRRWREPVELAALVLRRALMREPMTAATIYPIKAPA